MVLQNSKENAAKISGDRAGIVELQTYIEAALDSRIQGGPRRYIEVFINEKYLMPPFKEKTLSKIIKLLMLDRTGRWASLAL